MPNPNSQYMYWFELRRAILLEIAYRWFGGQKRDTPRARLAFATRVRHIGIGLMLKSCELKAKHRW